MTKRKRGLSPIISRVTGTDNRKNCADIRGRLQAMVFTVFCSILLLEDYHIGHEIK